MKPPRRWIVEFILVDSSTDAGILEYRMINPPGVAGVRRPNGNWGSPRPEAKGFAVPYLLEHAWHEGGRVLLLWRMPDIQRSDSYFWYSDIRELSREEYRAMKEAEGG